MKKCCNGNDERKDEMIRRWENLVLVYRRIREHPTIKLLGKFVKELLMILLRILVKKVFERFFDQS